MGLPAYIINFDELKEPIMQAIEEADLDVKVEGISIDSAKLSINTEEIEKILDELSIKLTNVKDTNIIIKETTEGLLQTLVSNNNNVISNINEIKSKIEEMVSGLTGIHKILEGISQQLATEGKPKIVGRSMAIPSNAGTYSNTIVMENNVLLTSVTISQSAWNFEDNWSLTASGIPIFNRIYTKLRGEHKKLAKFLPMSSGSSIEFSYTNASGLNSKYVWLDLEYIVLEDEQ